MKKIFALVLALMMAAALLPVTAEESTVMTHEEFMDAAMDTKVVVEG